MVTSEISLQYQNASKEAHDPLTIRHPFISLHTMSSLAGVNFSLLICMFSECKASLCFSAQFYQECQIQQKLTFY